MNILEILDKIMKKLNKKEKGIIIGLFDELHNLKDENDELKDENDELIDMFLNEKCFKNIKNKVCRKYKDKNAKLDKEECCPLCNASIADECLSTKAIIYGMIETV
jgi:hypothetical protein